MDDIKVLWLPVEFSEWAAQVVLQRIEAPSLQGKFKLAMPLQRILLFSRRLKLHHSLLNSVGLRVVTPPLLLGQVTTPFPVVPLYHTF